MPEAARVTDKVQHSTPPVLTGAPGSPTVMIGKIPAWRGVMAAAVSGLQTAKTAVDTAVETTDAAAKAAAATPGGPAAQAAADLAKTGGLASMTAAIGAAAAGSDIHQCTEPLAPVVHGPGVVISGSTSVFIDGFPAARKGDQILEALGPPNEVSAGLDTVLIGG